VSGTLASSWLDRSTPLPEGSLEVVAGARRAGLARAAAVSLALAALAFLAFCVSLSIGALGLPLTDVVAALAGEGESRTVYVVQELRLPRALTGLLVGLAFGLSGAIFQSLVRNALASPDIIGITTGASFVAVVMIVVVGETALLASGGALIGSAGLAIVIYLLAWRHGVSPYRLVLVGIGVQAVLSSAITFVLIRAPEEEARRADVWMIGSLANRTWDQAELALVALLVLAPLVLALDRPLRALALGEATATAVGVRVGLSRNLLLATGATLAAIGTAAAGPVSFVAFMGPPIARRLLSSPGPALIPSALTSAALLLVADVVARTAFGPVDLPVGIVTGILGAPFLIWLLTRANKVGSVG
jgi:iron complex transport system permease protein